MRIRYAVAVLVVAGARLPAHGDAWLGYAGDPQHSAVSSSTADALTRINWSTGIDQHLVYPTSGDLLSHYGSPVITALNTVIVPVRNNDGTTFHLNAFDGATGTQKWSLSSDYTMPAHDWTLPYSPTLTTTGRLYYAGAGGTLYYRDAPDTAGGAASGQVAFYGSNSYYAQNASSFNSNVQISTPLTTDNAGNVYFGFQASGTPQGVVGASGIAKVSPTGAGSWFVTSSAVALSAAPAISKDGSTLYALTNNQLVSVNTSTMTQKATTPLTDTNGNTWTPHVDSSASPMIAPDGDVYVGTLGNPNYNHDRGWLLHFNADLTTAKTPGAFGWDSTPSIIPGSVVDKLKQAGRYTGSATYLLMCKYNDYAGVGGTGLNQIAILDPTSVHTDPVTGAQAMSEVMTINGVTPDAEFSASHPGAVREWCINSAAVDPSTNSVLANSEDGRLYRWDLLTGTFTQSITLNAATGEAYTPTSVGPDGTVYAINDGILYAVVPEPTSVGLIGLVGIGLLKRRRRCNS